MKKNVLINKDLSNEIASMGHGDILTIVDCGYPISNDSKRIDLALKRGIPSFWDTLDTVLEELTVEKIIIAKEMQNSNQILFKELCKRFNKVEIEEISHTEFKHIAEQNSKSFVRTGENKPFSNIMLVSGVFF
jgi:D-ribose pyranase